ncbi:CPA1 family monovalent cation:H+ antiporter [Conyzicola lurida]|uniref:CPA1 family monovalent cation:H+ antiporter n=1 Tax=Conyzicola lurida TaxID=1172621 RepID=A0A841ANS5_9MICO|nr:sodium:proton antiporter [Conyzicola lurida]MBB5843978.1 CPA1 family monovalent cation:H+ antiporter [Conyzicola lurida]
MEFLPLIILVACSVGLTAVARRYGLPAPLVVTAVALAVSFIPGMPEFEIEPELILTIVLPPLLYSSSLEVSFQNFARSSKHIYRLGIGLVVFTALAVGLIAWWLIPGISLPAALLLGAVVSPPDAVSAAAIGQKLGLPRHVMTVLSGESLINDAASLTLLKVFVAIVVGSGYTVLADFGIFGAAVVIGVFLGVAVGGAFVRLRSKLNDPVIETLVGLLLPFALYIGAEHIGIEPFVGSGVIAVVAAGLVVGYNSPKAGYASRLQERPVWAALDVLLEGFVFALIGLQLKGNLENLSESDLGVWANVGIASVVLLVVILVRPLFVFPTYYLSVIDNKRDVPRIQAKREERAERWLRRQARRGREVSQENRERLAQQRNFRPERLMTWRELAVVSWTGMRGVVTLAAAASIPESLPERDSLIFIAFFVTVGTLLIQGLTLPLVIRAFTVTDPGQRDRDLEEEHRVTRLALEEGIDFAESNREEWEAKYGPVLTRMVFERMRGQLARSEAEAAADQQADAELGRPDREQLLQMRREILRFRREVLIRERDADNIDEEVMREVLLGIDAEEFALDTSSQARLRS